MKRLMDEGATDLERSLLDAGREVGSPDRGKAKLLATMAAGGALGVGAAHSIGASKAWGAWLGSSAGKASVVVALSVAAGGGWAMRQHYVGAGSTAADANAAVDISAASVRSRPSAVQNAAVEPVPEQNALREPLIAEPSAERQSADGRVAAEQTRSVTSDETTRRPARRGVASLSNTPERALLEETALLENVRRAVEQKDRNLAQTLSGRYWQRFATGQLAPEARRLDERWRALP